MNCRLLAAALALLLLPGLRLASAQSLEVWTDKQEYAYGEEIRYTVTLANDTDRSLWFLLSADGPGHFLDGTFAWNDIFLPAEGPHQLAPGEALLWKRRIQPQTSGLPAGGDRHWLRVHLRNSGVDPNEDQFRLADSISFLAPPYLGGQVRVSFADADTAHARAVREDLGAAVFEAAAYDGNQYQSWRFEGTALAEAVERYGADERFLEFLPYRTFEDEDYYRVTPLPARRPLRISVDTLHYPEQRDIVVTNVLEQAITVTGLSLSRSNARFWGFTLVDADTSLDWSLDPFYEPAASAGIALGPGTSLTLRVTAFDPCIVCKTDVFGGLAPDTLLIYTDASGLPNPVILDPSGYVSAEPGLQPGALQASVYPNPARGVVTIEGRAPAGSAVAVELFDALGRRVAVLGNDVREEEAFRIPFDASSLPAGLYLVRLTAGGSSATRALTLVR